MQVRVHTHTYLSILSRISRNERPIQLSFLIGGTWLSYFASLIFVVLFNAGLQGVKYKLEQMAEI